MVVNATNTPIPTPSRIFRIRFSFYKTHPTPLTFLSFLSLFARGDSPPSYSETGNFSLCKALVPAVLDAEGFFAETESFVNTLHAWAEIIRDFRPEAAPSGDEPPRLHDPGFITV